MDNGQKTPRGHPDFHSYVKPDRGFLFLHNTLLLHFLSPAFVLVLVQIDLIHFEHTKSISSTNIKTNTYLLHLRLIHTISCKIRHVIQIVPD